MGETKTAGLYPKEWRRLLIQWVDKNCHDWESNESVQKLFERTKTQRQIENLTFELKPFFGWIGINYGISSPDEIISLRKSQTGTEDVTYFEDLFWTLRQELIDMDYAPNSVITKLSRPAAFFSKNGIGLDVPKGFWEVEGSEKAKARRKTQRWPRNNEVRKAFDIANLEVKCMMLFGYQWGLLPGDISSLTWENLSMGEAPGGEDFHLIENVRNKTGEESDKVMNPDLYHCITSYWESKDKPESGNIFLNNRRRPYHVKDINRKWKLLISQVVPAKRAKALTFKTLRRAYNEAILMVDTTQEIKDALMGHKREGARRHYPIAHLIETYKKAFKYLTVNAWRYKDKKTQEIDQKLIDQDIAISEQSRKLSEQGETIKALTTSINLLTKQLEQSQNEVDYLKEKQDNIEEIIRHIQTGQLIDAQMKRENNAKS